MSNKTVTIDETSEFTQMLVTETLKLINIKYKDANKAGHVSIVFLARLTGVILFRSLSQKLPADCDTKEKQAKYVIKEFSDTKQSIQEAVAAAFSGAMHTYSGMPVEYYCQVKPVGPAANKEPI